MLRKLLKKYAKKKEGTTAIEFSMLIVPYLMLTLGIIELSLVFTSASLLEGATGAAGRMIRTGQIQESGADPETMFRDRLCEYATVLINCDDVVIDVIQMDSFTDFDDLAPTYDADGNMVSQGVNPGGSEDRVLIRTSYRYEMMTPFVGTLLGGDDGAMTFMSTLVMQTEPYDFDGAGG